MPPSPRSSASSVSTATTPCMAFEPLHRRSWTANHLDLAGEEERRASPGGGPAGLDVDVRHPVDGEQEVVRVPPLRTAAEAVQPPLVVLRRPEPGQRVEEVVDGLPAAVEQLVARDGRGGAGQIADLHRLLGRRADFEVEQALQLDLADLDRFAAGRLLGQRIGAAGQRRRRCQPHRQRCGELQCPASSTCRHRATTLLSRRSWPARRAPSARAATRLTRMPTRARSSDSAIDRPCAR